MVRKGTIPKILLFAKHLPLSIGVKPALTKNQFDFI